jgi:hypothetical protein
MTNKDQGIVRDKKGEKQPADKERAQNATSVEEKKKTEDGFRKPLRERLLRLLIWNNEGKPRHQGLE